MDSVPFFRNNPPRGHHTSTHFNYNTEVYSVQYRYLFNNYRLHHVALVGLSRLLFGRDRYELLPFSY